MSGSKAQKEFEPLQIAVVTVSDTRIEENDTSGHYLVDALKERGHVLNQKHICKDDVAVLRALVKMVIDDDSVHAVLLTGGTGFTRRDNTVVAITPLLESSIDGFGELFRYLSYKEIGSSTIQSRAFAGLSKNTVIFCMPGSPGACKTAWEGIIGEQLDSRHRPCNFVDRITSREV